MNLGLIDLTDMMVMYSSCGAVSFGYKTVDDYYFDASSSRSIKDVRVPLLCIQVLYSFL